VGHQVQQIHKPVRYLFKKGCGYAEVESVVLSPVHMDRRLLAPRRSGDGSLGRHLWIGQARHSREGRSRYMLGTDW